MSAPLPPDGGSHDSLETLAAALERLRLEPAGARTPDAVSQAQLDLLLARISTVTGMLRAAPSDAGARAASRLLLADLAAVAAQFRGQANALAAALTSALEGLERAGAAASEE